MAPCTLANEPCTTMFSGLVTPSRQIMRLSSPCPSLPRSGRSIDNAPSRTIRTYHFSRSSHREIIITTIFTEPVSGLDSPHRYASWVPYLLPRASPRPCCHTFLPSGLESPRCDERHSACMDSLLCHAHRVTAACPAKTPVEHSGMLSGRNISQTVCSGSHLRAGGGAHTL